MLGKIVVVNVQNAEMSPQYLYLSMVEVKGLEK